MKILGLGVPELLIILVVVLLIFGPKNLPKLGTALGKTVKGLRDGMGAGKKEASDASDDEDNAELIVEDEAPKKAESAESGEVHTAPKQVKKVVVKKAQ